MRALIFGAALAGLPTVAYAQLNPVAGLSISKFELFGNFCDAYPEGERAQVNLTVPDLRVFANESQINPALNAGRDFAFSRCPGVKVIFVWISSPLSFNSYISAKWFGGDQWSVGRNDVGKLLQADRERAAKIEDEQRKQDALKNARELAVKLQADFRAQTSLTSYVNMTNLRANPFPYQGQVVAVVTSFQQMTGSNEAAFGDFVLTDVPNTLFTQPGIAVVVAFKVNGLKSVKILGTDMQVVSGSYKGSYICKNQECLEFIGPKS